MAFYQINTMKQEAILRFSWLNERKDATSLSLTLKLVGHTLAQQSSCSSAETCQIMTALAVVPCHEQIHLCGAVCLTTPTSESPPKHICSRRMCSRYSFTSKGFKSLSRCRRRSWGIRGILKDLEDSSTVMKALIIFEENGATWFLSWHSTAGSFESSDHTH